MDLLCQPIGRKCCPPFEGYIDIVERSFAVFPVDCSPMLFDHLHITFGLLPVTRIALEIDISLVECAGVHFAIQTMSSIAHPSADRSPYVQQTMACDTISQTIFVCIPISHIFLNNRQ